MVSFPSDLFKMPLMSSIAGLLSAAGSGIEDIGIWESNKVRSVKVVVSTDNCLTLTKCEGIRRLSMCCDNLDLTASEQPEG